MADLGKNPVWAKMSSGKDTSADFLGPAYSYADNIPSTDSLGVGSDGSFGQIATNTDAVITYVKGMVTGDPPLGNQYFVNTGGTCTAPDGSLQSRYNYVNNLPSGEMAGLIPGILGDLEGMDPLYMFTALTSDSSPPCQCYQCPTTSGQTSYFLTPNLSPDFDPNLCKQVDTSNCMPSTTESFTNQTSSPIPTLIAFGLLVAMCCVRF